MCKGRGCSVSTKTREKDNDILVPRRHSSFPIPQSLFPVPCSPFSWFVVRRSLFFVGCWLFPVPHSLIVVPRFRGPSFPARCSLFHICHWSFPVLRSSLVVGRSPLVVPRFRRWSFPIPRSLLVVGRSSFVVPCSSFFVHRSLFFIHRSSFPASSCAVPTPRAVARRAGGGCWSFVVVPIIVHPASRGSQRWHKVGGCGYRLGAVSLLQHS
jgi:hypothetical protein